MVGGGRTANQNENLDKFTTPTNNINRCFFGRLRSLLPRSKDRGTLHFSGEEKSYALKLRAVKYAILLFFRLHPKAQSIHIQMVSTAVPSCLVKMGGTQKKSVLSKEIWDYLFSKDITITAEYLPGLLKLEADTQSRAVRDASKWKLNPSIFQKNCKYKRALEIDLFASQSHTNYTLICHGNWTLTAKVEMSSKFPGPTKTDMSFPHFV